MSYILILDPVLAHCVSANGTWVLAKSVRRRELLVEATREVLGERGILGVSVRSVAQRAGVSPGSVVYLFENFDEAVELAVRSAIEDLLTQRTHRASNDGSPISRLRRAIEMGIPPVITDELRIVHEAMSDMRLRDRFRGDVRKLTALQSAMYVEIIEAGVGAGLFVPDMNAPTIAANLVALENAYVAYLLDPDNSQREQYLANTFSFADSALRCEPDVSGAIAV